MFYDLCWADKSLLICHRRRTITCARQEVAVNYKHIKINKCSRWKLKSISCKCHASLYFSLYAAINLQSGLAWSVTRLSIHNLMKSLREFYCIKCIYGRNCRFHYLLYMYIPATWYYGLCTRWSIVVANVQSSVHLLPKSIYPTAHVFYTTRWCHSGSGR